MSQNSETQNAQNWCIEVKPHTNTSKHEKAKDNAKLQGVGVFFCIITLIGTKLGAGIIGLPYAVSKIGYTTAALFQLFYMILGIFSVYLLLRVREITGLSTLSDIGFFCYGRLSIFFINTLVAIAQLGFPIIFFMVFGDVAGGLIGKINSSDTHFFESKWFTHILLAICMLYLVLKKDISSLRYAGLGCFILIVTFILLYFAHYISSNPDDNPKADLAESHPTLRFWSSIPTICTSYAIHTSYYIGFNLMKERTMKNGLKAGIISLLIMFFIYQASSLLSYGLYGHNIEPNMLVGLLSSGGILPIILLIMFLLIAVMHIPIIFFIGKESVLIIFDEVTRRSYSKTKTSVAPASLNIEVPMEAELPSNICEIDQNNNDLSEDHKEEVKEGGEEEHEVEIAQQVDLEDQGSQKVIDSNSQASFSKPEIKTNPREYLNMRPAYYYLITTILFTFVVITSIVVKDVSIVFGIIGSVVSGFMILVGPGSFYIIATHKKDIKFTDKWSIFTYIMAWIFTIFGLTCMFCLKICVLLNAFIA